MARNKQREHRAAAVRAGLRYVSDGMPGIRRRRAGTGWAYYAPDGTRITDAAERRRFRALAIPPAWTDVWICPDPRGHLQVTARDARGRKQYRYHPVYRATRDASKFRRILEFGEVLPTIRRQVERHLADRHLTRRKVLATVVRLLDKTQIRVGNDAYARENRSFGLTTLRARHVAVRGHTIHFTFRGKSGVQHSVPVTDRRLARVIQQCQDLPGQELFRYRDEHGRVQTVGSGDVNDYLRGISERDITAKDFRTWAGTTLAATTLRDIGPPVSARDATRKIGQALDAVAKRLGNTRAVCRTYYVHPAVLEAFRNGTIAPPTAPAPPPGQRRERQTAALRRNELAVLELLQVLQDR